MTKAKSTPPKSNPQIVLRPQDLVVLLRLSLQTGPAPPYAALASELCLTASEIHAGLERAMAAHLVRKDSAGKASVVREDLRQFVLHGARYAFPATRGGMSRGMPTGYAAPPLADKIMQPKEPAPVWPYKNGTLRGEAFYPLYPTVPEAASRNAALYELLVLFDAVRGGSARERELAVEALRRRLGTATEQEQDMAMDNEDRLVVAKTIVVSRAALQKMAQRFHVHRLLLFGSAARGELQPDSDIDVLVEFESGAASTLAALVDIQEALSELFGGRKVDVATPSILNNPYRRRAIERDMEELYAA